MSYQAAGPAPTKDVDGDIVEDTSIDHLVVSDDPQHPANLICELCRKFYQWGWVRPPPRCLPPSLRGRKSDLALHDPLTSAGDGHRRRDEHPPWVWEPLVAPFPQA